MLRKMYIRRGEKGVFVDGIYDVREEHLGCERPAVIDNRLGSTIPAVDWKQRIRWPYTLLSNASNTISITGNHQVSNSQEMCITCMWHAPMHWTIARHLPWPAYAKDKGKGTTDSPTPQVHASFMISWCPLDKNCSKENSGQWSTVKESSIKPKNEGQFWLCSSISLWNNVQNMIFFV